MHSYRIGTVHKVDTVSAHWTNQKGFGAMLSFSQKGGCAAAPVASTTIIVIIPNQAKTRMPKRAGFVVVYTNISAFVLCRVSTKQQINDGTKHKIVEKEKIHVVEKLLYFTFIEKWDLKDVGKRESAIFKSIQSLM